MNNFNYLTEVIEDFFSQKRLKDTLRIIHEQEISGWETWLQIEFACFLSQDESRSKWSRESSFSYDRRIEKEGEFFRVDFLIRKKGWAKESFLALEFKQHKSATSCISNMGKDIALFRKSKPKQDAGQIRELYCIGVFTHNSDEKEKVEKKIKDTLEKYGYTYNNNCMCYKPIKGTEYAYCIF